MANRFEMGGLLSSVPARLRPLIDYVLDLQAAGARC
jgi:hypothetical protein